MEHWDVFVKDTIKKIFRKIHDLTSFRCVFFKVELVTPVSQVIQVLCLGRASEIVEHLHDQFVLRLSLVRGIYSSQSLAKILLESILHVVPLEARHRVPVVLDGVVGPTKDHVCYLSPPVLLISLKNEKYPNLFSAPRALLKKRVELIVPALTALLARPILNLSGDSFP